MTRMCMWIFDAAVPLLVLPLFTRLATNVRYSQKDQNIVLRQTVPVF